MLRRLFVSNGIYFNFFRNAELIIAKKDLITEENFEKSLDSFEFREDKHKFEKSFSGLRSLVFEQKTEGLDLNLMPDIFQLERLTLQNVTRDMTLNINICPLRLTRNLKRITIIANKDNFENLDIFLQNNELRVAELHFLKQILTHEIIDILIEFQKKYHTAFKFQNCIIHISKEQKKVLRYYVDFINCTFCDT